MRKQIEDSMSVVKNLEVTASKAKPNTFHFTCTVPGRIVEENHVSGIFVSDPEWLDWVVIIERGGKMIERHMKNTPLMRQIDECLTVELKKFVESVTPGEVEEEPEFDEEQMADLRKTVFPAGGPDDLNLPEFLRR